MTPGQELPDSRRLSAAVLAGERARKRSAANPCCLSKERRSEYFECTYREDALTVFVVGASGDLAKKKTYPSLLALYAAGYLSENVIIVGYARSKKADEEFRDSIRPKLTNADEETRERFLNHCVYRSGQYDDGKRIEEIFGEVSKLEQLCNAKVANRLFYFAIPPNVFVPIGRALKHGAMSSTGWNRFIIEKPFGKDLESFEKLNNEIGSLLEEKETFRIDHYIGKEMVQNLLVLRFANATFEPIWNRNYISSVTITFKEDIGTQGRGGYFDQYGIIRDVMQNHLLQVLSMVAMEAPVHGTGDYIRDEKVKVLGAMPPIRVEDCIIGQYTTDDEGKLPAYTDDDGVPSDSNTPTFAAMVMYINNQRWDGVPFFMRAGKALNERKSEVRIQFKEPPGAGLLFPIAAEHELPRNELVIRVQPNEAMYMKTLVKSPGLAGDPVISELDLSFADRFRDKFSSLPDAYTRLILQVLRGDSSTFVRDDELRAAWKIFTPLLHAVENHELKVIPYKAFTRGPAESDELAQKVGYKYDGDQYHWQAKY